MSKCCECGYLYVLDGVDKYAASAQIRSNGACDGDSEFVTLFCRQESPAFPSVKTVFKQVLDGTGDDEVVAALAAEHDCELACPYDPVRSPEELEEMNAHQMLVATNSRIADLQERIFDWKQQQAEQSDLLAKKIQALEEVRHQETRRDASRSMWIPAAIAIVGAIVSIAAPFVERNSLFKDPQLQSPISPPTETPQSLPDPNMANKKPG